MTPRNPFTPLSPGGLLIANRSPGRAKPPAKNLKDLKNTTSKGAQSSTSSSQKQHLLPDLGSDEHTSEGSLHSKRSRRDQSEGELSSPDQPVARNPSRKLQCKALQKRPTPRKPDSKKTMKELCTELNVSAQVGKVSETRRGWLKKGK